MTDTKKLTLDKTGLQDFVDNQIAPFQKSLDTIANPDNDEGVTVNTLTGEDSISDKEKEIYAVQKPLAIGLLATDGESGGDKIVKLINDVADSISMVFTQQIKLFRDLHSNLNTTVQKLMDGQHEALDKIDGKRFLDSLGTVPGDFQNTGNTGNTPTQS